MFRMLATDLDGTLLRADKSVSASSLQALESARNAGLVVAFVTGRPPRWLAPVVHQTGWHGLAIAANGAVLIDLEAQRIEQTYPIDASAITETVAFIRAHLPGARFAAELAVAGSALPVVDPMSTEAAAEVERLVSNPLFGYEPGYRGGVLGLTKAREASIEELTEPGGVIKLLARAESADHPDEVALEVEHALRDVVTVTHSTTNGVLLEISAAHVNKGTGLAQLAKLHNIKQDQVVAVGDMPNDLPMLAWAGRGFAVANAHHRVLAAPGVEVIASNEEDGVAQLIESLIP